MRKIALVVFDMAGTTIADSGNVNDCFREAFASEGLIVKKEDVDEVMGYRKIDAVRIIVDKYSNTEEELDEAMIVRIHDRFSREMVLFYEQNEPLAPLPFAEQLFKWLHEKGIKVALNTGFTRNITNAILKRLGWDANPNIDAVICSDEVPGGRPEPFMIRELMQRFGITDPAWVVKVGDTEVDVNEGRNVGCGLVIAVTTGAYTQEQLEMYKPDHIIDSLEELTALIEN